MRFIISTVILLSLTSTAFGAAWEYIGSKNPLEWSKLFPGCGGVRQSPIDIDTKYVKYGEMSLKPFTVVTLKSAPLPKFSLINDGHKVEVGFPDDVWKLEFVSEAISYCFKPVQMHWHWGSDNSKGSEHLLNNEAYPLELHVVMYNCRLYKNASQASGSVNGLAVLGVWYEIDDSTSDPLLERITNEFQKPDFRQCECKPGASKPEIPIDGFALSKVLPDNVEKFYRYMGSLTTPPCTENVLWTVYATPKKITTKQMKAFRSLLFSPAVGSSMSMVNNFRPAQQLNPLTPISTIRYVSASFNSDIAIAPSLLILFLLNVLYLTIIKPFVQ